MSQNEILFAIEKTVTSNDPPKEIRNFFIRYSFYNLKSIHSQVSSTDLSYISKFYDVVIESHFSCKEFDLNSENIAYVIKQLLLLVNSSIKHADFFKNFEDKKNNPLRTTFKYLNHYSKIEESFEKQLMSSLSLVKNMLQIRSECSVIYSSIVGNFFCELLSILSDKLIIDNKLWKLIKTIYESFLELSRNFEEFDEASNYISNVFLNLSQKILLSFKATKAHLATDSQISLLKCISEVFFQVFTPFIKVEYLTKINSSEILENYLKSMIKLFENIATFTNDSSQFIIKLIYTGFLSILTELRIDPNLREYTDKILVHFVFYVIKTFIYDDADSEYTLNEQDVKTSLTTVFKNLPVEVYKFPVALKDPSLAFNEKVTVLFVLYIYTFFSEKYLKIVETRNLTIFKSINHFLEEIQKKRSKDPYVLKTLFLLHVTRYNYFVDKIDWYTKENWFFVKTIKKSNFHKFLSHHPAVIVWILYNPLMRKNRAVVQMLFIRLWLYQKNCKLTKILKYLLQSKPEVIYIYFDYCLMETDNRLLNIIENGMKEFSDRAVAEIWHNLLEKLNEDDSCLAHERFEYIFDVLKKTPPLFHLKYPLFETLKTFKNVAFNFENVSSVLKDMKYFIVTIELLVAGKSVDAHRHLLEELIQFESVNFLFQYVWQNNEDYSRCQALSILLKIQSYQNDFTINCLKPFKANKVLMNSTHCKKFAQMFIECIQNSLNSLSKSIVSIMPLDDPETLFDSMISLIESIKLNVQTRNGWDCLKRILKLVTVDQVEKFFLNAHFKYLFEYIYNNKLYEDAAIDDFLNYYSCEVQQFTTESSFKISINEIVNQILCNFNMF